MSNQSRFDTRELLSGNGGYFFNTDCLYPLGINRYQCDIRLSSCKEPLLAGTRGVLLLGSRAMDQWLPEHITKANTLHELRGSAYQLDPNVDVTYLASYLPQDAVDIIDHEKKLNILAAGALGGLADDKKTDDDSGVSEKRRHSTTFRANYRFWLKKDVEKLVRIIKSPINPGRLPAQTPTTYEIYPNASIVIDLLLCTKQSLLFFDMETTPDLRITCFAFGFGIDAVFVVPVVRHDYSLAYDNTTLARIFRALTIAIRDNTLIAHNGAGFDFFVLGVKYHIPIGKKVYDTMIAQHRIYPDIEKSLGHCTSLWTYEPYHKDEANFSFGSVEQAYKLWAYCGKDVSTMIRIYEAQQKHANTIPGLRESIDQANASIRPYLITTILGISYNVDRVIETMAENDRLLTQYLRMIKLLIGAECSKRIKPKSKTSVECLPMSNSQCTSYFHKEMGYKVQGYGKVRKDGSRAPSLAEKLMLKLRLQYNNPVIDLCLAYRQTAKESSSLKFTPLDWR